MFHCEPNYIEVFRGDVKRYARENCYYSFVDLEDSVKAGLNLVSLTTIWRFANWSRRWIIAYISMGSMTGSRNLLRNKKDRIIEGWVSVLFNMYMNLRIDSSVKLDNEV